MPLRSKFAEEIKTQLLSTTIKSECCKNSFICGTEIFSGSRKNIFSSEISAYVENLKSKKQRFSFDEDSTKGYIIAEKDGDLYPAPGAMVCEKCISALIRGVFLVAGRASKTNENLHVEMVMPNEEATKTLTQYLTKEGLAPKFTVRRGEALIYYKKTNTVEEFLAYIGAKNAFFEIMNDSIVKSIRCSANRQKNCDTTNVKRSIEAAAVQVNAINAIMKNEGDLLVLSPALRETAKIRIENPIESLEEITALHIGRITKSGVNHRLYKIVQYALKKGYIGNTGKNKILKFL